MGDALGPQATYTLCRPSQRGTVYSTTESTSRYPPVLATLPPTNDTLSRSNAPQRYVIISKSSEAREMSRAHPPRRSHRRIAPKPRFCEIFLRRLRASSVNKNWNPFLSPLSSSLSTPDIVRAGRHGPFISLSMRNSP